MVVDLIFGEFDSSKYDWLTITPVSGIYNAPERDIDEIEVQGRNGTLLIDNGRYQNIDITFKVVVKGGTESAYRDYIDTLKRELFAENSNAYNDFYFGDGVTRRKGVAKTFTAVTESPVTGEWELVINAKPQIVTETDISSAKAYFDNLLDKKAFLKIILKDGASADVTIETVTYVFHASSGDDDYASLDTETGESYNMAIDTGGISYSTYASLVLAMNDRVYVTSGDYVFCNVTGDAHVYLEVCSV